MEDEANKKHWAAVEKYKEEAKRRSDFSGTAIGEFVNSASGRFFSASAPHRSEGESLILFV